MDAGKLRHRILLQTKTVSRDTFGAETVTWTTLATVWGSVEPMRGQEFIESQRAWAEVDTRMRIRYRDGLVPTMRATWSGHVYDVKAVIEVEERKREVQLMCREVVSG